MADPRFDSRGVFDFDGHDAAPAGATGPAPDLLIHRAAVFERGVDADDVKRRLARGEWQVIRRGVYARTSAFAALAAEDQHRLRIAATLPQLGGQNVVSHRSAACLHGMALLRIPDQMVQVTNPGARAVTDAARSRPSSPRSTPMRSPSSTGYR